MKSDHSKDKTVEHRKAMRLLQFDCRNDKVTILTVTEYDADGTVSDRIVGDGSSQYIVPDSITESFAKFVCPKAG